VFSSNFSTLPFQSLRTGSRRNLSALIAQPFFGSAQTRVRPLSIGFLSPPHGRALLYTIWIRAGYRDVAPSPVARVSGFLNESVACLPFFFPTPIFFSPFFRQLVVHNGWAVMRAQCPSRVRTSSFSCGSPRTHQASTFRLCIHSFPSPGCGAQGPLLTCEFSFETALSHVPPTPRRLLLRRQPLILP